MLEVFPDTLIPFLFAFAKMISISIPHFHSRHDFFVNLSDNQLRIFFYTFFYHRKKSFAVFPIFVFGLINLNIEVPKAVSQLGDISFEVYIFHYPLMVLIQLISEITGFYISHSYLIMILFLVFVWIAAWLMWKLLDLPLRRKMRELEKRYE